MSSAVGWSRLVRIWTVIAGGIVISAAACGDDEPAGVGPADGGDADARDGGSTSSSSGGASSSGGSSGSSGSSGDARVPNVGTWRQQDASGMPTNEWVGIWGAAADDIFIAGNSQPNLGPGASVWRWSAVDGGLAWRRAHGNSGYHFYDISGTSKNDVWAVGYSNSSVGYDGGTWGARAPAPGDCSHIWAAGPGDYWAVRRQIPPTLLHYTGGTWTTVSMGARGVSFVWGVAGHVYVLGYGENDNAGAAQFYLYDGYGGTWKPTLLGTKIVPTGVWGSSPNDLFIVGYDGLILHWDGATLTKQTSGVTDRLYAVWGTSAYDVFAVGSMKAVLHYDGTSWTPEPLPASAVYMGALTLYDIWGSAPNDIWAVGDFGVIVHRTP